MFGFGRKKEHPTGPDFGHVTSEAAAVELARQGQLEKIYLLPPEFGGADIPQNYVYAPVGFAAAKQNIDLGIIGPLVADGTVTQYTATPEYSGASFIPIAIRIEAHTPGRFTSTLNIWGEALSRTAA